MAACVRAFLGEPILIILERPTVDVQSEIMPGLMHSIRSVRERGRNPLADGGVRILERPRHPPDPHISNVRFPVAAR